MSDYRADPCPYCGADDDPLMDRPALKTIGWNYRSGILYRCTVCGQRVTEASVETGITDVLEAVEETGGPPTSLSDYRGEADG